MGRHSSAITQKCRLQPTRIRVDPIFDKAGQPGWAALIPIYNVIVLLQIVGRPVWWFILMLIPFVGFIIGILVVVDLAKSFGQSVGFAIGFLFLPFIFAPLLAFGDASYRGPAAA